MNLEYEISLEYDRDRLQAYWEHSLNKGKIVFIPMGYFPVFLCLGSIGLIFFGLLEPNADDSGLLIGIGIPSLLFSILLFCIYRPQGINFLSSIKNNSLQKQWSEYYSQKHKVNIILTPEEFILKTDDSEKALAWKALKSLSEYSTGFVISFFNGYAKFIPKSIFEEQEKLNNFKKYIKQYQSNY